MTPDEQEALSRKYSNDIVMLLPVASGRVAVLSFNRQLLGFLERDGANDDLRLFRAFQQNEKLAKQQPQPKPLHHAEVAALEDIELELEL